MAHGGVLGEFREFRLKLTNPSNHDETEKQRMTAISRAILRLFHGISRPPMKNGGSLGIS